MFSFPIPCLSLFLCIFQHKKAVIISTSVLIIIIMTLATEKIHHLQAGNSHRLQIPDKLIKINK